MHNTFFTFPSSHCNIERHIYTCSATWAGNLIIASCMYSKNYNFSNTYAQHIFSPPCTYSATVAFPDNLLAVLYHGNSRFNGWHVNVNTITAFTNICLFFLPIMWNKKHNIHLTIAWWCAIKTNFVTSNCMWSSGCAPCNRGLKLFSSCKCHVIISRVSSFLHLCWLYITDLAINRPLY